MRKANPSSPKAKKAKADPMNVTYSATLLPEGLLLPSDPPGPDFMGSYTPPVPYQSHSPKSRKRRPAR